MARFLSTEWIAAFNNAVDDADLGPLGSSGSVRAESGHFSVEELVSEVPDRSAADGPLRVVLTVDDGKVTMAAPESEEAGRSDVVVTLSYQDAAAMSRGELDPTQALGMGRVHVRGDLAVLVAGQAILASAAARLGPLQADTSY
jgi:putative sterol carrier protein